jgi:hypothetical protein
VSTLYLAVSLVESREQSDQFFDVLRSALRTRFAVRSIDHAIDRPQPTYDAAGGQAA